MKYTEYFLQFFHFYTYDLQIFHVFQVSLLSHVTGI